jgi:molybdate transport repressor ModE-like protein
MRVVLAVHAHGSIAAAARDLCVSPPAVSKAIAEAEDILGLELFRRSGRHPVVTEAGEVLVRFARTIVNEFGILETELSLLAQGSTGSITIGTATHQAKSFIGEVTERLKARQPRILIRMLDLEPPDVLTYLRDGRIEIAFGDYLHVSRVDDIDGLRIFDSETVLVASIGHPALDQPSLDWPTLNTYAWALPPHSHPLRTSFEALWADLHVAPPTNIFESSSLLSIPIAFSKMQVICPAPRALAEEWARIGAIAILPKNMSLKSQPQGMLWSREHPQTAPVREFLRIAAAMIDET